MEPGSKNIIRKSLVEPTNILLPPLHIKLDLMKQFVKALNKDGDCFAYLGTKFPGMSDAKLKEGIFGSGLCYENERYREESMDQLQSSSTKLPGKSKE